MANTLTNLIPVIYSALDTVSREMVGFIPAVFRNSSVEQAALNQQVTYPVTAAAATVSITPGVNSPDAGDQTIGNASISITKSKMVPIRWNGEDQRTVMNGGFYTSLLQDQFTQAFRAICNEVEGDIAANYMAASRAYGTAGTTPFGTAGDLSDIAQIRKILVDNGAGESDLRLVLGTTAGANLRGKQSVLFKVNEAGSDAMLRTGALGTLEGLQVGESSQTKNAVKGTGAGYLVNSAGLVIGSTTIPVDTGAGTILAGDIITIAADPNKYVVKTALTGGNVVIQGPGLLTAWADNSAITVGNNFAANMAFRRGAIHLVTRAPALPVGPDGKPIDIADDVMTVTDPISGLTFQVCLYRQYKQIQYQIGLAWGTSVVKGEHTAILLG
jgi:hypothetical protein